MNQTKRLPSARFGQLFSIVALALLLTAGLLWQTSQLAHASAQVALPAQDATPTDIATDTATDTTTLTDVLNIPITSAPTATVVATRTTNAPSATATARSTGRATSEAVSDSLGNTTINSATVRTTETVTTGTVTTGTVEAAQIDAPAVLTGTIFANRTALTVQFFLDGQVYELAPRESTGLTLRRASTVVNLYSCEAERPESDDCFWDSYPVRQDGFYEITNGADAGDPASLLLDEAGPPPGDQIWVQNRTGQREQIVYGEGVIELSPSETQQIEVETEEIATLFLRTCVALGGEQACEWAPVNVRTGAYYALVADEAGPAPANATRDAVTLETVAGEGGVVASTRGELEETEETEAAAAEAEGAVAAAGEDAPAVAAEAAAVAPGNTACTPQVQALNVRAGPGFEYLTLGQLYSENGAVAVSGQDAAGQWLALADGFPGGWIINDPTFAQCQGNLAALPLAPIADGRLAETEVAVAPAPAVDAPVVDAPADAATGSITGTDEATATATVTEEAAPAVAAPPPGGALFIVNNGFDHEIRFTLDPNEYDLLPGQSVNVEVNPGFVRFSVSSPWGGLSGNKELFVDPDTTRILFLRFEPDPNSDNWDLRFE